MKIIHLTVILALLAPAAFGAEIWVYEDADFRGDNQVFTSPVANLKSQGWNDKISSVRIESGVWEFCHDSNFRNCGRFEATSISNLGDYRWNDTISSLRPITTTQVTIADSGDWTNISRAKAETLATRLYIAILDRGPDDAGMRTTADDILSGRIEERIESMLASREFAERMGRLSAERHLEQIYDGLLRREPDRHAEGYLPRLRDGRHLDVILGIMRSKEFDNKLDEMTERSLARGDVGQGTKPAQISRPVMDVELGGRGTLTLRPGDVRGLDQAIIILGPGGRATPSAS